MADGETQVEQETVDTEARDGEGIAEVRIEAVGELNGHPVEEHEAVTAAEREAGAGEENDEAITVDYDDELIEALPELARLAALAWTRTAAWGLGVSLRTSARLARASVDPVAAAELLQGMSSGVRSYAREFLGISDLEDHVRLLTPPGDRFAGRGTGVLGRGEDAGEPVSPELALRTQGAELLRQSADVTSDDRLHPAFGRILGELAPDEGRILRLLASEGAQPVVDVRAANLIGVGSQLVAQNLNMVAMPAGLRHADRVPAYLVNLQRLGLAAFMDDPLDNAITYQVLEAQPHVLKAIKATARAKTVQRSLQLTPFGEEFCAACFPLGIDEVKELTSVEQPFS